METGNTRGYCYRMTIVHCMGCLRYAERISVQLKGASKIYNFVIIYQIIYQCYCSKAILVVEVVYG